MAALSALPWERAPDRPRGVRRHAGQEAEPAADLRRALRRLLPAAGRRGRPAGAERRARRRRSATTARRWPSSASCSPRRWPTVTRRRWPGWPSRWWAGSARCPAAVPGCPAGRRTPRCSGSRPPSWSTGSCRRCSPQGRTEEEADRGRRAPGRRLHPPGRGRRPPPDRRGEGPRPRRRRRDPAEHRPDRLHRRAQGRPRGDAPRDLPAGPPARDPAHPGAPRPPARPARLPAHRPRLDLHRRRTAGHPPPAQAPAPQRARRAVRRERLGRELRAVHAAAGLRAARPVPEGPGVHLHRPRPRGDPALQAGRRRRRRDGRPRRQHRRTPRCGAAPTTAARSPSSSRSTPTRSARSRRC